MTRYLGTELGRWAFAAGRRPATASRSDHKRAKTRSNRVPPLNRVDEIIIFNTLSLPDMEKIVDLQMKEVAHG